MYLHIGSETIVSEQNLIGIFDLDNTLISILSVHASVWTQSPSWIHPNIEALDQVQAPTSDQSNSHGYTP